MKKYRLILVALLLIILACTKGNKDECSDCIQGTLRDYNGFDGCGWIIELSDLTRLEPLNLDEFNLEYRDGKTVLLKYFERSYVASICMIGKVIEIEYIE